MMRVMRFSPRMGSFTLGVLAAFAAWSVGGAQLTVVGVVRDSAGLPIVSAEVTIMGKKALSDSLGRFHLAHAPADNIEVSVRRLGFENVAFTVSAAEAASKALDVVLRRVATTLAAVDIEARANRARTLLAGFDARRERGTGVFVTRADIEKRNTRLLTDVLRQQRGVILSVVRGVGGGARVVRFTTYQSKNCVPLLWLDGQAAPGLDIDAVAATDVEGVELYQSMSITPAEFHRANREVECGTIVIWTKRPIAELPPAA